MLNSQILRYALTLVFDELEGVLHRHRSDSLELGGVNLLLLLGLTYYFSVHDDAD